MKFINREISWLSFNYRVLQEAKSKDVPLYERIKFLAIFSSNLDEFFRVRVASLRSLLHLKKKKINSLNFKPGKLLNRIHKIVNKHQEEFGRIFRTEILPDLENNGIRLYYKKDIPSDFHEFFREYFKNNIANHLNKEIISGRKLEKPLENKALYFAVELLQDDKDENAEPGIAIVQIPSSRLPRFVEADCEGEIKHLFFLDDIVRFNLPEIFPAFNVKKAYSIKLTRDAELYIDDEFTGNLLGKIKKSLEKRSSGLPSRFLYDGDMPGELLIRLKELLMLEEDEMVPGATYHNFNDFFTLPGLDKDHLRDTELPALRNELLGGNKNIFNRIVSKDHIVHFPFHTYNHVIEFLDAAAKDPLVSSIKVTQYRVASRSEVVRTLINAVKNGKEVVVFVEVKARFDEESNLQWAEEMEKAGVKVYYSFPGLKVHAKIAIVKRNEPDGDRYYSYLSSGNFNEKNARIYTDIGFFTSDTRITTEIEEVFEILQGNRETYDFKHLLVAQFGMRRNFERLIDNEIEIAKTGGMGSIFIKLNGLEDKRMIKKLYEASAAGVKIRIICRGICCIVPGMEGLSDNIEVISIVDRFLEHSRIFIFGNGGDKLVFTGSADWMKRNLSRRIEVVFPIYDKVIRQEVLDIMDILWSDNVKARIIDPKNRNKFREYVSPKAVRSQYEIYNMLAEKERKG